MRVLLIILAAITIAFIPETNAQQQIGSANLASKLQAGETTLDFVGGGIRKKYFFSVYSIGLYSPGKVADEAKLLAGKLPVGFSLQITSGVVNSEKMATSVREGFDKSTGGNTKPLAADIDRFISIFEKDPIVEGDVFNFIYTAETGVSVYKNNKLADSVTGLDFAKALFGIWIGPNPIDASLKKALLGGK